MLLFVAVLVKCPKAKRVALLRRRIFSHQYRGEMQNVESRYPHQLSITPVALLPGIFNNKSLSI